MIEKEQKLLLKVYLFKILNFEVVKCSNDILKTPEEVGKLRLIYDEAIAMFNKKVILFLYYNF